MGSGKSSLLSAVIGEMNKTEGTIIVSAQEMDEGFALVAQEPWIQHATIKENILFGRPFDRNKYERVLEACALHEDLKVRSFIFVQGKYTVRQKNLYHFAFHS